MRLIDADELKPDVEKTMVLTVLAKKTKELYSQEAIDKAPTIEAEPVRHGEWIEDKKKYDPFVTCNLCGLSLSKGNYIEEEWRDIFNFCPNCGAKMNRGCKNRSDKSG